MKKDKDAQFLCKDCSRFNLCKYYSRREENSYICKYFHLTETYEMTNGDVMKALFPNCVVYYADHGVVNTNINYYTTFSASWWNAPYKKEEE